LRGGDYSKHQRIAALSGRNLWRRALGLLPVQGFHFGRPLLVLQSDDWGRVGVRDQEGWEQIRAAEVDLGERPYDFYTLETADDVDALQRTLERHRDSTGRPACMGMNFIQANLDFGRMKADGFRHIELLALSDGLPEGWERPGLFEAYRDGIAAGVFHPGLHGTTHFCRSAVELWVHDEGERGDLVRKLWRAGTPYIYWRMPWIGYEYWNPEGSGDRFLSAEEQSTLIGQATGMFSKMLGALPHSACAPGYRANENTSRAWAQFGISVAQNGPGEYIPAHFVTPHVVPPHFDGNQILQLYRNIEFEPATNPETSVDDCVRRAGECFRRGIPAIVSMHSINFHSSLKDFRSGTLALLDQFLGAIERQYPELLYVHDREVFQLVQYGLVETEQAAVRVKVTGTKFKRGALARGAEA
jgi:hypothetical protein